MKCYMTGKPCDFYRPDVQNGQIFLVAPFGFPYDSLYQNNGEVREYITRTLGLRAQTSDHAVRLGSIMCHGICKEIMESEYLFADVSSPNPNVYYELGLGYSLRKQIIACASADATNPYLGLFEASWLKTPALVRYPEISSLKDRLRDKLPKTRPNLPVGSNDNRQILILENGEGGIGGLYQSILERALKTLKFEQEEKSLTDSERASFDDSLWRAWELKTVRVGSSVTIEALTEAVADCKVCVVDTTAYRRENLAVGNPYMYFCLGLAHGMEKEVIPVTNTTESATPPFDVKGLWHIFFRDEAVLQDYFRRILAKISVDFHKQREKAPYKKIWDPFFESGNRVSIFYYGRPAPGRNTRGPRTNIDSWDTRAVSEASFYLAQSYPTAVIKAAPPRTKRPAPSDEVIKSITTELGTTHPASIIVGSPDNNDYAELVLARIYNKPPFQPRERLGGTSGFIFHKTNLPPEIRSSFYIRGDKNLVEFPHSQHECTEDITYGVLTISKNPYAPTGRVVVLSGFTGLATCGLMELLIEGEPEPGNPDDLEFRKHLNERLKDQISRKFDARLDKPFTALVKFEFETIHDPEIEGDNRALRDALVDTVIC